MTESKSKIHNAILWSWLAGLLGGMCCKVVWESLRLNNYLDGKRVSLNSLIAYYNWWEGTESENWTNTTLNQILFYFQDVSTKRPINTLDVDINISTTCSLWADELRYWTVYHVDISLLLDGKSTYLFPTLWYLILLFCTIRRYFILHI